MRNILLISLMVLGLTSCVYEPEATERIPSGEYKMFEYGETDVYHIQEIDGCEYILVNGRSNQEPALTHKGNCKYCLERNQTIVKTETETKTEIY
jgi:hypothetical protein